MPDCKHPYFGDKGGLDRHKREVHGSKTYCCPITSCKRHARGFPRKYNLSEHQKRCHPDQSLNAAIASIQRSPNRTIFDRTEKEKLQIGDDEASSPEMEINTGVGKARDGRLREKLERLCALRTEIDGDIEALKRALDVLGDSSL